MALGLGFGGGREAAIHQAMLGYVTKLACKVGGGYGPADRASWLEAAISHYSFSLSVRNPLLFVY